MSDNIIQLNEQVIKTELKDLVKQSIEENNMIERLNREIRRRTCVVGTFLDGESAPMMVCAHLRHVQ